MKEITGARKKRRRSASDQKVCALRLTVLPPSPRNNATRERCASPITSSSTQCHSLPKYKSYLAVVVGHGTVYRAGEVGDHRKRGSVCHAAAQSHRLIVVLLCESWAGQPLRWLELQRRRAMYKRRSQNRPNSPMKPTTELFAKVSMSEAK